MLDFTAQAGTLRHTTSIKDPANGCGRCLALGITGLPCQAFVRLVGGCQVDNRQLGPAVSGAGNMGEIAGYLWEANNPDLKIPAKLEKVADLPNWAGPSVQTQAAFIRSYPTVASITVFGTGCSPER
jgi:hypothetical protein